MVDQSAGSRPGRAPWHLWVVGVLSLLWNGFGAYDYLMTNTQGDAYMRGMGMTEAQIAYYHSMPTWMTAVWAIGVWGATLGSLLLLLRRRWAFPVFVVSLIAYVLSLVYTYGMSDGADLIGPPMMAMQGLILIACLFFVWYSRAMAKRGVLR